MNYSIIDTLVILVLFLVTLGVGISLNFRDYKVIFTRPKVFFTGLGLQMVFLPILAFAVAKASQLPPEWQVGLVILAACPGGATSNVVSYFLSGNAALSISLTSINGFVTLFTIPMIVNLGLASFMDQVAQIRLPFWDTFLQIFFITIIPAALGVYLRNKYEMIINNFMKPLKMLTLVLLAAVFLIKFLAKEENGGAGLNAEEILRFLPFGILFNVLALFTGFIVSHLLQHGKANEITTSIEVGMQNTTLAFLIAGTILQNQDMLKPSLIYAMFSFWTGVLSGWLILKYQKVS